MKIQQLETCCCVCSLELGSKIIGWLEIVGLILVTIALIVIEFVFSSSDTTGSDPKHDAVQFSTLITLVCCAIALLSTIVLLLGINKKRPSYIMAWIVVTCIGGVLFIYGAIGNLYDQNVVALRTLGDIVGIVLNLYCLLVVYSYYREMKETQNMNV